MKSNSPLRRMNSAAAAHDDSGTLRFVNRFSIHAGTDTQRSRAPTPYETLGARVAVAASVPATGDVSSGAAAAGASVTTGAGMAPAGAAPTGSTGAGVCAIARPATSADRTVTIKVRRGEIRHTIRSSF